MQTDAFIQKLFAEIKNLKWRECESNNHFEWYYAEDNHYIVRHKETGALWFVKAKSPNNACETAINNMKKTSF